DGRLAAGLLSVGGAAEIALRLRGLPAPVSSRAAAGRHRPVRRLRGQLSALAALLRRAHAPLAAGDRQRWCGAHRDGDGRARGASARDVGGEGAVARAARVPGGVSHQDRRLRRCRRARVLRVLPRRRTVRYDVSHALHLTYSRPGWEHHVEVRLTPQHNAHQHVLASELTVDPNCEARSYLDGFGNQVHYFSLIKPHDHLTVQVNAQVDTLLGNPFDFTAVAPAREREWLSHTLRAQPRLWDYLLHPSAATPDFARLSVPDLPLPASDP